MPTPIDGERSAPAEWPPSNSLLRRRLTQILSGLFLSGVVLLGAKEAQASEPRSNVFETDLGIRIGLGLPPDKRCQRVSLAEQRRIRLREGTQDDHGHHHGHGHDDEEDDCSHQHPPFYLSLAYGNTWTNGGDHNDEHAEAHLPHRAKLQLGATFRDLLSFGVKLDAGAGENLPFQVRGGFSIDGHFGKSNTHELVLSTIVGKGNFEVFAKYRIALYKRVFLGVNCLVKGHGKRVLGGCGPVLSYQGKYFGAEIDLVVGHHLIHAHSSLMVGVGGADPHSGH